MGKNYDLPYRSKITKKTKQTEKKHVIFENDFSCVKAWYKIWIWAAVWVYQVGGASKASKNIADRVFVFCFIFSLAKFTLLKKMNFDFRYHFLWLRILE